MDIPTQKKLMDALALISDPVLEELILQAPDLNAQIKRASEHVERLKTVRDESWDVSSRAVYEAGKLRYPGFELQEALLGASTATARIEVIPGLVAINVRLPSAQHIANVTAAIAKAFGPLGAPQGLGVILTWGLSLEITTKAGKAPPRLLPTTALLEDVGQEAIKALTLMPQQTIDGIAKCVHDFASWIDVTMKVCAKN